MAVSETGIVPRDIAEEMRQSYLDYAMSVIVSRALPDVRDGLKPVQRRILHAMGEAGNTPDRPYRKSAKTVGEVLGNYHPHGDAAVYDALVRMAQDFTLRYPLVDGHGNMGSVDGDPPAAMRYCVTGDTLVVTDAGLVPMDRLAREGEEDVRLRVLSMGGKVNTASKWFDCGPFPTWRVRTRRGYEVTGTANHPLLACVRGEDGRATFVWKTVAQLRPGDWLVLDRSELLWPEEEVDLRGHHPDPRSLPEAVRRHELPSRLDEDLAFILGALVAEGTFRREVVEFTGTPGELADAFRSAWASAFPGCGLHAFLREPAGYGRQPFWRMRVVGRHVVAFLRNLSLAGGPGERRVPEVVLRSPRAVAAAFLRGLYEGGGSPERSGRSLFRIGLCAPNRALLWQVQVLLLRFGIASTLSRDRGRGTYRLGIVGVGNLSRFAERIGFVSPGKREALAEALVAHTGKALSRTDYVPFPADFVGANAGRGHREWLAKHNLDCLDRPVATLPRLREALPADAGRWVEELARLNCLLDRVTAVEDAGERRVYSLRVDSQCHSFVANGFFNHNTEARLSRLAMELLRDLDKDTADFQPNFDGTAMEPVVLPARFPNLLVNGSSGIAVGMATNIPPHNLGEVIEAAVALIDDPHLTNQDLMRIVRGPDFPTGGLILGREGIARAYETGRGTITLRARAVIEEGRGGRWRIVVTELPYEVNKARLLERIAELVRDRRVEGIAELRDETDRTGTRVVVELARGANAQVVLNQLYHHTQMQVNYGVIMLALVDGQPRILTLREALQHYVNHQREVVTRRSRFELARAEERAHILEGLRVALNYIDAVIALIRGSRTPDEARAGLREQFGLSEKQAQAILDMRLQRLTGLEREKIEEEYQEVQRTIEYLRAVLGSERMLFGVIRKELLQVRERFADPRRTQVTAAAADLGLEDLVADEPNVVTLSYGGYVKRLPLDTYRSQQRGGRGVVGMTTRQEDFVADIYVASTLDWLLFFTSRGRVYRLRVHELPEAGRAARGTALVNLLPLEEGEKVQAVVPVRGFEELVRAEEDREGAGPARDERGAAAETETREGGGEEVEAAGPYLFLATRRGFVKRTPLTEFASLRRGGMIALTLEEGDELIGARLTDGNRDMALVSRLGLAICFPEGDVRPMGRTARGVRGISLRGDDQVVALVLAGEGDLLVVTEGGYGKRTPWSVYRRQGRGGKGIMTLRVTAKNGPIVAARSVEEGDEVLLITGRGVVTRQAVAGISRQGRDAQGVMLMRLEPGDAVVAIATVETED